MPVGGGSFDVNGLPGKTVMRKSPLKAFADFPGQ
jgi:hypothetical protein